MKPYYENAGITIYHGDCREVLPSLGRSQCAVVDPPYGETSLEWDSWQRGFMDYVDADSMWVFGSLRMFMLRSKEFASAKWSFSQEIVWEKHNGSNFHADRFRRIHELAALFYQGAWEGIYKCPQFTNDATARAVRRKGRPPHTGNIEATPYVSFDGGPRLQRSVIQVRSCHGHAQHPTQKPLGIVEPLVLYSCPPGGMVVDPFMGSGTVLVAAKIANRSSVGIEIKEEYCEIAAKRLEETLSFDEAAPHQAQHPSAC